MKRQTPSTAARTVLGALFLTLSLGLIVVAVNFNVLSDGRSGALYAQAGPTPIPQAPADTGPKIGYENFTAPGVLTPVKTTEAGQQPNSVEYLGRNAGEPSVGSNWATGVANFQSGLQTLFITFDESCPLSGLSANWVNRAAPTSVAVDSDPIGFTDRSFTDTLGKHSRVFAGELTLLSPNTVKISYSDDDGSTWVPTQSGGLASAVDHETIGGGIYATPVPPRPPGTVYPYAVYYCSQDIATALCSRSDNGGLNYGPSIPIYSLADCGGLHGHVKVSPKDGTVYVPNPDCDSPSKQAVVVSDDNGTTWTVRDTPIATTGGSSDPSIGIDSDGKVYFLGAANSTKAIVATSIDKGAHWTNVFDLSSEFGLNQIAFPAAVAGDSGRAAVAFYGSTGTGDSNAAGFQGVWHLYVSHTFDGGQHWTTTDVTPNAPMQRAGLLRGGGANITRNLLDFFDITIDRDGRVVVGYVDGCEGGPCKQAADSATGNAYTSTAVIARQSSGRRFLQGKDPATATSVPGMPSVTQRRVGQTVHLGWSEADTGNSPITGYQIWRGAASNTETLLTTVPGTQTGGSFDDLTATDNNATYYYKVLAVNAVGTSCANNEVAAPYVGEVCSGIIMHKNDPSHPEANAKTATPPSLLIDYISVGEPPNKPGMFMFKMKVNDLSTVPPNSRWRITWNSADAETYPCMPNPDQIDDPICAQQFYVGMTTGPSGPPTFEYGTLADAGVPAVFVISETKQGDISANGSNYQADGTITMFAPKTAFGPQKPAPAKAPPIGSLLGAMGGRTLTGDAPGSPESKLERSNAFVDHTFIKAQADNGYPASTYMVAGNIACETANNPPTAVLKADPKTGSAPLKVTFDGTGSSDPDFSDTIATYTFSFGDGSPDVTGGAPIVDHSYTADGTYVASLVVTDSRGAKSQNTALQVIIVGNNPTPTPTPAPSGTPSATPTPTASPTATPTPTPTPGSTPANVQLLNISGRVYAQTGDKVGIAGFIITGSGTKRVMARGLGPSMKANGIPVQGRLQDPYLELHDLNGSAPLVNDNWRDTQEAEIEQTGLAPSDDHESAIVKRLPAGNYTAIIHSADNSTSGVGLVELFDLSSVEPGELGNLSVRADVGTDDNVLIDGLILRGADPKRVLFRALGPSLNVNGTPVDGRLQDTTLDVYDANGNILRSNDNWRDAPNAGEIEATGIAPPDDREAAVLLTFQPGNYTAVVRGANRTTGIGLAEAYKLTN
ncbi:MAG: PKD domain-containing protein [Chthoniobacterales bacterium]